MPSSSSRRRANTATVIRRTFNGGEIAPWVEGRTDVSTYNAASRRIENLIPTPQGGLERRPGTRYVSTLGAEYRLIDFVISGSDAYLILLGDYEMRFVRSGGLLNYSNASVNASDVDITANQINAESHGFYHGQKIRLLSTGAIPTGIALATDHYVCLPRSIRCGTGSGKVFRSVGDHNLSVGMGPFTLRSDDNNNLDAAGEYFISTDGFAADEFTLTSEKGGSGPSLTAPSGFVTLVPTEEALVDTFRLSSDAADLEGTVRAVSGTGTGPHVFGTLADEVVAIGTPWSLAEAWELDYIQDENTMYFAHKDHKPYELRRFNTSSFRLVPIHLHDGPYGEMTPAGLGVELKSNTATANSLDYFHMSEFQADIGFFSGYHVGLPLRKSYGVASGTTRNINKSLSGHIERLADYFMQSGPQRLNFYESVAANVITTDADHGLTLGELVVFVKGDGALPAEVSERTVYYVLTMPATDELTLSATLGGPTLTITSSGSDHKIISLWFESQNEAGTTTPYPASGFLEQKWAGVTSRGELPTGIEEGHGYIVKQATNLAGSGITNTVYLTHHDGTLPTVTSEGHGRITISSSSGATKVDVPLDIDPRSTGIASSTAVKATTRWWIGEWNAKNGWPSKVAFHQQRLIFANSYDSSESVWASIVGTPDDFAFDELENIEAEDLDRSITDASGFSYRLLGGRLGEIRWVYPGQALLIGSENSIAHVGASTNREAITPTNVNAEIRQRSGVAATKPIDALGDVIYQSQAFRSIQSAVFDGNSGSFAVDDITLMADHVCTYSTKQLAWQAEPYGMIWDLRTDGTLWAATYSSRQGIAAWHRHTLGGTNPVIESIATITENDSHGESYDRLYLVVTRTVDGATVRFLEYLDSPLRGNHTDSSAYYVDAGITGAATPSMSGLTHLEGETVRVWADAAAQADVVVSSGSITLADSATVVSAGLPFAYTWESLPFESDLDTQITIQGHRSRIVDAQLRLYRSLGGQIGRDLSHLYDIDYRTEDMPMDSGVTPFTGLVKVDPGPGHGDEAVLAIYGDNAAPFHLVAMLVRIDWADRS